MLNFDFSLDRKRAQNKMLIEVTNYMNRDMYTQYIAEKIESTDSLGIFEFKEELINQKETIPDKYQQYLEWDLKAMSLADKFIVFNNDDTCLVNEYEIGTEKYPDIDSFTEEQLEFYSNRIDSGYSNEVVARYCNILIQCAKSGHQYVDRAITEMQEIIEKTDNDKARKYISRILWLAIRYNKSDSIIVVIQKLKNIIRLISANDSDVRFLPWNISLYSKAVFVKNQMNDDRSEVEDIVSQCRKVVMACDTSFELSVNRTFEELISLARKLKDEELCRDIITSYIDYELSAGDVYMKEKDYCNAAASYERAVLLCNKNGLLSRVNRALMSLKNANLQIGESVEPITFSVSIQNNRQLEQEIDQFISGSPAEDFRRFVTFMIGNVLNNVNNLYPCKKDALEKAQKRMQKNWFWDFISIVKMTSDRKIAETTSAEENERYMMYEEYIHHIKLMSTLWFEPTVFRLKDEGLSAEDVTYQLIGAEWLSETNKLLIDEAIQLLWEEKYIAFMHIAIPTYESIFRRLFGFHDLATTHMDMRDGSQKEKIFGEFLRSDMVKNNVPARLIELSEVIFTDQLGLNLRNNIAHGLCEKEDFNKNTAYIIFQMLILITTFDWIANNGKTI